MKKRGALAMNCPREPRGSSADPLKSATKESCSRGALQKIISADLSSGTSRKDHTVGVAFFSLSLAYSGERQRVCLKEILFFHSGDIRACQNLLK